MTRNRIFLAHATEDKKRVRQLYKELRQKGFSPWLDSIDLVPGQNWRVEIPKAIRNAAFCLACLSKKSTKKRGYVHQELREALSVYAELPPDTIYLIPVRSDECDVPDIQIPTQGVRLRDLHWVDLFEQDGLKKLIATIKLNIELDQEASHNVEEAINTLEKEKIARKADLNIQIDEGENKRVDDEVDEYKDALIYYVQKGDLHGQGEVLRRLGKIAMLRDHLKESRVFYFNSRNCFRKIHDHYAEAAVLLDLGIVLEKLHEHDAASAAYRDANRALLDVGMQWGR